MTTTTTSAADRLRTVLRGRVLTAADEDYHRARRVWNGAIDRHPALIAVCAGDDDVVAAVRTARDHGLPISVRAGGHDWAGRAVRDGGLLVDLSGMRAVSVDPPTETAQAQGGVRAGDLAAAAQRHGLAGVTGTVRPVGVAGLTLAGGYGPFIGRHGLALDNLLAATVVLADGRTVTASATEHPDLFWALRGGGGNFGVVTRLRYQLHRHPTVLSGVLAFPLTEAAKVLRGWRDLAAECPDELSVVGGFFAGEDGVQLAMLLPTWSGEPAGGEELMAGLRRLGNPVFDTVGPTTMPDVLSAMDPFVVDGRHNETRSRWLPEFSDPAIALLVEAAATATSPMSGLTIHHFHGAATRVPVPATAFGLRREHLLVEIISTWPAADADPAPHRRWARALSTALAPGALDGGYPNLLGADEPERVRPAFGPNAGRLAEIKRRYDPDGVFRAIGALPES
jgi:FAD/FMN-containing dehydrogenase